MNRVDNLVSISEANQNFSNVARKVKEMGEVIILKNNKPLFVINNIDDYMELTDDEKLEVAARRILRKYHNAFEELAKFGK